MPQEDFDVRSSSGPKTETEGCSLLVSDLASQHSPLISACRLPFGAIPRRAVTDLCAMHSVHVEVSCGEEWSECAVPNLTAGRETGSGNLSVGQKQITEQGDGQSRVLK